MLAETWRNLHQILQPSLLGWVSQVLEGLAPSLLQGAEEMQHSICPCCKLKFRIRKNCLRKQLHVEKGAVQAHITNRSI